jgi:hypothetical protein
MRVSTYAAAGGFRGDDLAHGPCFAVVIMPESRNLPAI